MSSASNQQSWSTHWEQGQHSGFRDRNWRRRGHEQGQGADLVPLFVSHGKQLPTALVSYNFIMDEPLSFFIMWTVYGTFLYRNV